MWINNEGNFQVGFLVKTSKKISLTHFNTLNAFSFKVNWIIFCIWKFPLNEKDENCCLWFVFSSISEYVTIYIYFLTCKHEIFYFFLLNFLFTVNKKTFEKSHTLLYGTVLVLLLWLNEFFYFCFSLFITRKFSLFYFYLQNFN